MWVYSQSTGKLYAPDGRLRAKGYSGFGDAKNVHDREYESNLGPIPKGEYVIGSPYNSKATGPFSIPLIPNGHNALNRHSFLIHGDSVSSPGNASKGCIILARSFRYLIHETNVRLLKVIQ